MERSDWFERPGGVGWRRGVRCSVNPLTSFYTLVLGVRRGGDSLVSGFRGGPDTPGGWESGVEYDGDGGCPDGVMGVTVVVSRGPDLSVEERIPTLKSRSQWTTQGEGTRRTHCILEKIVHWDEIKEVS